MKNKNTSMRLKEYMSITGDRQVDILNKALPVAAVLGEKINKANISQYVSGKIEPKQDKVYLLALALNVSEAWLMGYDVPMERHPDKTQPTDAVSDKARLKEGVKKGTIQITGRDGSFVERELTDDQIDIVKRMVDQMPVFRRSTNHLKSPPENQTPLYPLFPDPSSPINYWDDRHTSTQMLADDPFPLTPPKQNRKTPPEDDET